MGAKETFILVLEAAAGLFPGQKLFLRRPVKTLLPGIPQDQGIPKKDHSTQTNGQVLIIYVDEQLRKPVKRSGYEL